MRADAELDALVAERVMGKEFRMVDPASKLSQAVHGEILGCYIEDERLGWREWRPSTSWDHAGKVVARTLELTDGHFELHIGQPLKVGYARCGFRGHIAATGFSAPHAICLAALKAVEDEDHSSR